MAEEEYCSEFIMTWQMRNSGPAFLEWEISAVIREQLSELCRRGPRLYLYSEAIIELWANGPHQMPDYLISAPPANDIPMEYYLMTVEVKRFPRSDPGSPQTAEKRYRALNQVLRQVYFLAVGRRYTNVRYKLGFLVVVGDQCNFGTVIAPDAAMPVICKSLDTGYVNDSDDEDDNPEENFLATFQHFGLVLSFSGWTPFWDEGTQLQLRLLLIQLNA